MPCSLAAVRHNLAIDSIVGFLVDYVCYWTSVSIERFYILTLQQTIHIVIVMKSLTSIIDISSAPIFVCTVLNTSITDCSIRVFEYTSVCSIRVVDQNFVNKWMGFT